MVPPLLFGRQGMGSSKIFDIAIIGGGINGAGIAADAAGRGLTVCLLEQNDLASGTSSASSKLIHGGLRYLEHYEFALVREALAEREILLKVAPHIITPLHFVLPHVDGMRSRWFLRAGLFLYDNLAKRQTLPASRGLRFSQDPSGVPLQANLTRGFSYWDCWVDDARLVVLNARAAAQKGASIQTRTRVTGYQPNAAHDAWGIETTSPRGAGLVQARVLINAAGPWVDGVAGLERGLDKQPLEPSAQRMRKLQLVKGSHIVVPRVAGANDGYVLQGRDGRVVFALPFEEHFTLIGTTDVAFDGDPAAVVCSAEEEVYLLKVFNRFFVRHLSRDDIKYRFSGVRPLFDDEQQDPSKVSRDYHLDLRREPHTPPILTVLGGKITTYRRLAEDALDRLSPLFPNARGAWTAGHPLPGGALGGSMGDLQQRLCAHYPNLDAPLLNALSRRHGMLSFAVLGDAKQMSDLGQKILPGLTEREVCYLRDHEWATSPDDVLWRRTKFGLTVEDSKVPAVTETLSTILDQ